LKSLVFSLFPENRPFENSLRAITDMMMPTDVARMIRFYTETDETATF